MIRTAIAPKAQPRICLRSGGGTADRGLPAAAGVIAVSSVAAMVYVWFLCPLDLAPDEAHYWDWSRHLDWSYYSKGPLVAWLIRASCELFGPLSQHVTGSLAAAVRLPAALCHAATLAAWYALAAGIFRSSRFGLAVVVLAALLPVVRIGAVLMTIDPPFLACWSWALLCVERALRSERLGWWIGAGAATAIGVLAKYTMELFPAAVVGYLLVHRRREFGRAGVWIMLLSAAAGGLPILAWNALHDWVSFRHVIGQVGGGGGGIRWLGPVQFLGSQAGMMFGLWLVAFLFAAWRFRPTNEQDRGGWPGRRLCDAPDCANRGFENSAPTTPAQLPRQEMLLLWWCAVPVWCVFVLASLVKSGQTNWPAPAYVAGFVLAAAWVREQLAGPRGRLVAWCLGVNVALGLLVVVGVHYPRPFQPLVARLVGPPSERDPTPVRRLDITARLHGWRTLAAEVDRVRERLAAETGAEPVLAATHWSLPGHLGFSCTGQPTVYAVGLPNRSDRHSQYDFWRPNPVSDAQEFRGRAFVIVGEIGLEAIAAFERVESPIRVMHREKGIPLQTWTIWVCHGFRGFDTSGLDAGY
jgi:dolichyl-phosphate-mannose-protein mannosyltransferase